jgi:hypothetical protein
VDFDQSLNKSITRLRAALGDSAENPRFIETLPKRGYRFIAPLFARDESGRVTPDTSPTTLVARSASAFEPGDRAPAPADRPREAGLWSLSTMAPLAAFAILVALLVGCPGISGSVPPAPSLRQEAPAN